MKINKTLHTLLCGLAVSALLLSCAALAAWQVSGTGSDSARAAALAVSAWVDGQTLYVSNSENGRTCEVALRYSVTLGSLPEGVTVYFDGVQQWSGGSTCVIQNAGELPAGSAQTNTHTITFDTTAASPDAETQTAVTVTVQAEQTD